MIDKISSWKFAEEFNTEPEAMATARKSAEELGVESVTVATGAGLATIAVRPVGEQAAAPEALCN